MAVGGSSKRALEIELSNLMHQPLEGFSVQLVDDSDLYKWDIRIFGPPETLYQGGYFKARLNFPRDYPYNPPKMKFLTPMFHPNIYGTGEVCISILHAPGADEVSGEPASERWNPTQSVRTILLSVISLLTEPNISSPANVDASVMFRRWKEMKDNAYEKKVRGLVAATEADAKKDEITVPKTLDDYVLHTTGSTKPDSYYFMDPEDMLCGYDDDDEDEDGDIGYEEEDGDDEQMFYGDEGVEDDLKAPNGGKPAEDNDSGMN
ncbi:ubiquitin-conjugating enzyme E2 R2-like [Sycon ciliatum]|uniref:ubiquitin-conjugating enzyme E2 R2-like n=1 Tax=Sycon ciliatum TaxID=27933 RepID=UPI0020AB1AE8|eukprot:scpid77048/ scgid35174/ Ubiquitin-conjugating enzyme E2 R2; Ubiquitin carrier protein R2; Ubiquitin-conjugating enzyme E2-CDC34B; Ubiquitin-protein ligase R2 &gt; Ubiquitin-conjugating enzyme E2 R2; Ubiquitin carrier protein R2; Ubiquitin-conjugating enzyme E2-CDC34B; Ubiquitin-protein ligase R2 &gt; Ubiquitin-conjugating enzyme E2 R2; Ubiquitin carrier protein R2; Ubiquitin-conjugating enzyme E2-CDC34B; Ubiquitin-protein ligase R2